MGVVRDNLEEFFFSTSSNSPKGYFWRFGDSTRIRVLSSCRERMNIVDFTIIREDYGEVWDESNRVVMLDGVV